VLPASTLAQKVVKSDYTNATLTTTICYGKAVLSAAFPDFRMDTLSFRALLYRYFFYGWLFDDVNVGNLWQRCAAGRHNREQARWLPTYMRRWFVLGASLFAVAFVCEKLLGAPVLSAVFYVPSALSVPFNAVTALAWGSLVLDRSPG